jgi:hypothetical protein
MNHGLACTILTGGYPILVGTPREWDTIDFDKFFFLFQDELELRIPDKYLKAKGYYRYTQEENDARSFGF